MDDGVEAKACSTFGYVANYDEQGVKQAERVWYAKSLLTSRAAATFVVPGIAVLMMVLLTLMPELLQRQLNVPLDRGWLGLFGTMRVVFALFLVLSVAYTLFFYLMRPFGSWAAIRKSPRRTIKADQVGVEIDTGGKIGRVTWEKVQHVWQTDRYLMLVIGKYLQIPLPKQGMPAGMEAFIRSSAGKN